jgi:hypothetical protein
LRVYQALSSITGSDLVQCLKILQCTTLGLSSLADVLDPQKLFPNSYLTITVTVSNTVYNVYIASNTINPLLPNLGSRLNGLIPPASGQAWLALQRDLDNIKGLENTTTLIAGKTMSTLETVTDLPLINDFTQYVPANTQAYWNSEFGMGTGPGNTVTAYDILGTAVGSPETGELSNVSGNLKYLNFNSLLSVYSAMSNTLAGQYGNTSGNIVIPPGTPGAGTYSNANVAFTTGLIPAGNSAIITIAQSNTQANTNLWTSWQTISYQLYRENDFLNISGIGLSGNLIANSDTATMGLISSLHNLGLNSQTGGYSDLLSNLATTATLYGQAVVASLREGRNIAKIDAIHVTLDAGLDSNLQQ